MLCRCLRSNVWVAAFAGSHSLGSDPLICGRAVDTLDHERVVTGRMVTVGYLEPARDD